MQKGGGFDALNDVLNGVLKELAAHSTQNLHPLFQSMAQPGAGEGAAS